MANAGFEGFKKEAVKFLQELIINNNREWFKENKNKYDRYLIEPAGNFAIDLGKKLKTISNKIVADPRIDKSIFRIHRDIRFSKNKTPYKTHLGIIFWDAEGKKMQVPGIYIHIEPGNFMIAVGMHKFSSEMIKEYRKAVVHDKHGKELAEILDNVKSKGDYEVGRKHYKRYPKGYDKEHVNSEYLLYNALYAAYIDDVLPQEVFTKELIDFCFLKIKDMMPVYNWLLDRYKNI